MQDGFVGDVCDFGKYGLLRRLCHPEFAVSPLRLGMVWYFVNGDGRKQGKHFGYLQKPGEYRVCDSALFDDLEDIVASGDGRTVAAVQSAERIFPPNVVFFDEALPCDEHARKSWFGRALAKVGKSEVVFVDPDNGVGGEHTQSPEHASWSEIRKLRDDGGKSTVIYQHLGQGGGGSGPYAARVLSAIQATREHLQLARAEEAYAFWLHRGSGAFFIMVPRKKHAATFESAVCALTRWPWCRHFCLVRLP